MEYLELGEDMITEEVLATQEGESIILDKYHFTFKVWEQQNSYDTYGGKLILEFNGEPLFSELLILRLLEQQGFKGVWVDTYRNKFWQRLPHLSYPVKLDSNLQKVYDSIYKAKGGKRNGCFDVIAKRKDQFVFIELKRKRKDKIRESQVEWVKAGLSIGFSKADFIIAEWQT